MIVVRQVFQGKYGKAGEIVETMKQAMDVMSGALEGRRWRLLTDLSGPFDTIVLEVEAESLSDWDRARTALFANTELDEIFERSIALIESGRNELYTLEAQG